MKIKQILFAVIFATVLVSCGSKSADIKVTELETACDHVNALLIVMTETLELMNEVKDMDKADIPQDIKDAGIELTQKAQEISKSLVSKEFTEEEQEKCESYAKLETAVKKLNTRI